MYRCMLAIKRLQFTKAKPWWNVYWARNSALAFRRGGTNRFNPIATPYDTEVLYAGSTQEVAIAEAILRWRDLADGTEMIVPRSRLEPRRIVSFETTRPLELLDFTGAGLHRLQRAVTASVQAPAHAATWRARDAQADDIFLCRADEYPTTQAWVHWMRACCPTADGLRWASRQYNIGQCVVLFGHCRAVVQQVSSPLRLMAPGSQQLRTLDSILRTLGWGREP
jgi:hypothetical protein